MQRIIGLIICSLLVLAVPARAQFISAGCGSSSIPCFVTLISGSASIGTVTQGTAASSGPWIFTPWIGGAVNSATNGLYTNLLQGNAVISGTNPLPVTATYANIATDQVTVGATATLIVAARTGRQSVTIFQEGAVLVRVGASGVTMSNGVPLIGVQGANIVINGGQAVYGIVGTGSQAVSFMEVY
jgi:hypothetical protein